MAGLSREISLASIRAALSLSFPTLGIVAPCRDPFVEVGLQRIVLDFHHPYEASDESLPGSDRLHHLLVVLSTLMIKRNRSPEDEELKRYAEHAAGEVVEWAKREIAPVDFQFSQGTQHFAKHMLLTESEVVEEWEENRRRTRKPK